MLQILGQVLQPTVLIFMLLGTVLGIVIGALPGLTATMAVAILTPMTFWLQPEAGMAMLIAVYCSSIFAGGVPAILVNTPGTPASIATTFDGPALTRQGKAGLALGINAIFSALGGIVSTVFLLFAAFPISKFALSFGPPEYFALAVFGLSMMIAVSGDSVIKGIIMGGIGLFIVTIGLDPILSYPRFTFGSTHLLDGLSFVPIMIGMFGLGEVFYQLLSASQVREQVKQAIGKILPNKNERRRLRLPFALSSAIGTIIGAIPGAGGDIASLIAWDQSRRISKHKEEFGKGSIEGLCSTATANNAIIGGAFTTMLTLGLPGDTVTAILIGALMMYGMTPGPNLFTENVDFVHTIIALLFISNILLLIIGLMFSNIFSRLMRIRQEIIWISVVFFSLVGAYALNNSYFDVWVMVISGVLGFVFRKFGFPLAPLVLGLVLGSMAESNFLRSFALQTDGSVMIFITRPISLTLLLLSCLILIWPFIKSRYGEERRIQ